MCKYFHFEVVVKNQTYFIPSTIGLLNNVSDPTPVNMMGKMWKSGSSFAGNVGVWWEILSFCTLKMCNKLSEKWPASWEIHTFFSPDGTTCQN